MYKCSAPTGACPRLWLPRLCSRLFASVAVSAPRLFASVLRLLASVRYDGGYWTKIQREMLVGNGREWLGSLGITENHGESPGSQCIIVIPDQLSVSVAY